jgi:hypothetical protein
LGDTQTDAALANLINTFGTAGANVITANALQGNLYTLAPGGGIQQVIPATAAGTTVGTSGVSTLLVLGLGVLAVFLVMGAGRRQG